MRPLLVHPIALALALLFGSGAAFAQAWGSDPSRGTFFPDDPRNEPPAWQPPEPRPPRAPEPPAAPFGSPGQVVVTFGAGGANGAGITSEQFDQSQASYLGASAEVGLDFFVVRHVSVGFDASVDYSDGKGYGADGSLVETRSTAFSGGARFGLNLPLGERFSFYPRLTLGLESVRETQSLVSGTSVSVSNLVGPDESKVGPWLNLFAPLLFHAAPQFFLGVGPRLTHGFADATGTTAGIGAQPTTIEAAVVFGGVFGGEAPPASPDVPSAPSGARVSRFGDAGTVVISGESDAFAAVTHYSGTSSSEVNVDLAPGFDVFLADHFSLGLDLAYGSSTSTTAVPGAPQVTLATRSFGVAPRAGLDLPLGRWLSIYTRAEIGVGRLIENETSASGAVNDHDLSRVWVSAEAPLLVHPVRHFFVGAGPWVSHELQDQDQNGYSNLGTDIGLSALLGGWL